MKKFLLLILSVLSVGALQAADLHEIDKQDFTKSQGDWTIDNVLLPDALTYIWSQDNTYGMKATAYLSATKTNYASESWLISPELDLSKLTNLKVAIDQAANFLSTTFDDNCQAYIIDGQTQTKIAFTNTPTLTTKWTFVKDTVDLTAYCGKSSIKLAFKYVSTDKVAPTWEIKTLSLLSTDEVGPGEDDTQHAVSIHAMKTFDASSAPDVTFEFQNLLVTYVNGRNVFLQENQNGEINGLLCYLDQAETVLKAGDVISGEVTGTLKLYNQSVLEYALASLPATVVSSGNEVTPQTVTIADITNSYKDYEAELVTIRNVQFSEAAWNSRNNTVTDDSDNSVTVRDNFNVATSVTFDTEKSYNVTALVSSYKGVVQIYPRSAEDIELITSLKKPAITFANEELVFKGIPAAVTNAFRTESDGTLTWQSSNEEVATVDASGNVTVKRLGNTVITVSSAETSTWQAAQASYTLYVLSEGDGSKEKPFVPTDLAYYNGKVSGEQYIEGYIVGYWYNNAAVFGTDNALASNISIANTADETNGKFTAPVQLKSGSDLRAQLNLKDNPSNLGMKVVLAGEVDTYFTVAGVKNLTANSISGVRMDETLNLKDATIYNILGQKVNYSGLKRPGVYLVNGKKVYLK